MAEGSLKCLDKASKSMPSDAIVSELSACQATTQPAHMWYGKEQTNRRRQQTQSEDEEPKKKPRVDSSTEPSVYSEPVDEIDACLEDTAGGPPYPGNLLTIPSSPPDGTGTMIAILDSGINITHTAFTDKISPASRSFVSDDILDVFGHGTQCAGLACGSLDTVQMHGSCTTHDFRGIAPGANVMVCKVVPDGKEEADIDAVCRALDYIVLYNEQSTLDNRVNVVSLSFGVPYFSLDLTRMIQKVIDNNTIVVCAASNDGRKSSQPITYPARLGHVLCIGSCNSDGKPSSFSPAGRELDFLAFGENVWAPTSGGPYAYKSVTGTSFATPLVGGIICQIVHDLKDLTECLKEPFLEHLHNVWGMREILKHMSVIQGTHNEELGFGKLVPMKYFGKTVYEKNNILLKILTASE